MSRKQKIAGVDGWREDAAAVNRGGLEAVGLGWVIVVPFREGTGRPLGTGSVAFEAHVPLPGSMTFDFVPAVVPSVVTTKLPHWPKSTF